jgi:hypothetical protein
MARRLPVLAEAPQTHNITLQFSYLFNIDQPGEPGWAGIGAITGIWIWSAVQKNNFCKVDVLNNKRVHSTARETSMARAR